MGESFGRMVLIAAWLALAGLGAACTSAHSVRTIGKGNFGVEASLGGPFLTNLGAPFPAPNLFLGGRYGVLDELDLSLAYNLTAPITPGIALDLVLGEHWVPIQPGVGFQSASPEKGWSLATAFSVHALSDFETGFVAIPVFDLAFGYRYRWLNPFLGASLGLNFFRPFDEQNVAMLNPYFGVDVILTRKASLSLRVTFYDVAYNMYGSQVKWVYLVDDRSERKQYGAVALTLGFAWDFVRAAEPSASASADAEATGGSSISEVDDPAEAHGAEADGGVQ